MAEEDGEAERRMEKAEEGGGIWMAEGNGESREEDGERRLPRKRGARGEAGRGGREETDDDGVAEAGDVGLPGAGEGGQPGGALSDRQGPRLAVRLGACGAKAARGEVWGIQKGLYFRNGVRMALPKCKGMLRRN
jgi:hypothetical protein